MLIQNQVGPITVGTSIGAGTLTPMRAGNLGDAIVSELHGRYYEAVYRKNVYSGAGLAQTTSVGLATTFVGLVLTNPIGSPVNLSVSKFGYAFLSGFATVSTIGLAFGFNSSTAVTQTTPVTPKNNFINGPSGYGLLATAATLPTAPTVQIVVDAGLTGAITTSVQGPTGLLDLEGCILIPPGGYICSYTSTASSTANANFSFMWEEVPV